MTYDILIRGGTIVDGTGQAAYKADLGITGGEIVAIDTNGLDPAKTGRIIDAHGMVVAPGFIDIKTHSDFTLPINPDATSKVRQGVTTEIIGHCGFSIAPVLPGKVDLLRDYLSPSAPWITYQETSFKQYVDTFPAASVNVGMLVGHNTMRLMAMGMDQREPTPQEMQHMVAMLEEGLAAGAIGLSSGLFTSPGSYASTQEMHALGHVLNKHKSAYFTHIRDESNHVLPAVQEAIDFAKSCDVHVEIVHFKCSGMDNWGKARTALEMIAAAKANGLKVDCDSHPYTAGSNPLKNLMPQWVQAGGVDAMIERLGKQDTRDRIRNDIASNGLNNWGRIPSWDCVQISISPHLPQFAGRTIQSLAAERNQDPIDVVCDYMIADKGATRVLVISISEDDIEQVVADPTVLVGSDGNCVACTGITGQGMPHPRFYGTFPRILSRYVRERKVLSLEHAIRKMTGATAQALQLQDRGLLKPGYAADITLFDPDDFDDQATYDDPHRYPTGDRTVVLVNGVVVVENAQHTGARPGMQLRRDPAGLVHGAKWPSAS